MITKPIHTTAQVWWLILYVHIVLWKSNEKKMLKDSYIVS